MLKNLIKGLRWNEKGQGMVEYGLILSLVVVVAISALGGIGGNAKSTLEEMVGAIGEGVEDIPNEGEADPIEPGEDVVNIPVATDRDFRWVDANTYTHSYKVAGQYYKGYYQYVGDSKVVKMPDKINGHAMTSYYNMFYGSDVEKVISENANITNLHSAFANTTSTSLDLKDFNTSGVTLMEKAFSRTQAKSLDLSTWDVSSVKSMSGMLENSQTEVIDLGNGFNLSSIEDMSHMVSNSMVNEIKGLGAITGTNNLKSITGIFRNSKVTSLDLSKINFGQVESFANAFEGIKMNELDISMIRENRYTSFIDAFKNAEINKIYVISTSMQTKIMRDGPGFPSWPQPSWIVK